MPPTPLSPAAPAKSPDRPAPAATSRPAPTRPLPTGRRRGPTDAERAALVEAEQTRARKLCERARIKTPPQYHEFIVDIHQRKNLGTREDPIWAEIELPYMTVDGRCQMARDEHKAAGKQVKLPAESAYLVEPVSKQLICQVRVELDLYGSAVAHARVFLGGGGANETNPLETAETSAVGRALGFLGYGCFGTGIASADEVLRAGKSLAPESPITEPAPAALGGQDQHPPANPPPPASAHADEIERLAQTLRLSPGALNLLRAQSPSDAALLQDLQRRAGALRESADQAGQPSPEPLAGRGDFLRQANELGVSTIQYMAFLKNQYGAGHPADLTPDAAERERQRWQIRQASEASRDKFRAYCQQLSLAPDQEDPAGPPAPPPAPHEDESVFTRLTELFDQLKTPARERVTLMKQHRGQEAALAATLEALVSPARPAPTDAPPPPADTELTLL